MRIIVFLITLLLLGSCEFDALPPADLQQVSQKAKLASSGISDVLGIIRIDPSGNPSLLLTGGHDAVCIDKVEKAGDYLHVYFCETASNILKFDVSGDECLGRYVTGASTELDYQRISFYTVVPRIVQARFVYNGSSWNMTKLGRSKQITLDVNTPNHIRLSHDKAEFFEYVDDNSENVDFRTNFSKKFYASNIYIDGTPQAGDAFWFRRELDLINMDKIHVPIDDVVGGATCNIQLEIRYN